MKPFGGLFTAMITPFRDGKVDEEALQSFVEWQVAEGVHGLVPCGTTGESPTLSHAEHKRIVELTVEAAAGRVKIMAGAGSNNTEEAIEFTRHAKKAGADAVLVVAPYYNKPPAEGLLRHYRAVADAADLPNFIYNIPGRSVINIADETLAELSKHPNIAGVKDATGDLARVSTLRALAGDDFTLLSGEDMTAIGFNAQGGDGCISVTGNIAPRLCTQLQILCDRNDYRAALAIQDRLVLLHDVLFAQTSPIPVKYAVQLLGKCTGDIRLPLIEPSQAVKARVDAVMKQLSLI